MGTETEPAKNRITLKPQDIVGDLRRVIRKGLPVSDEKTAGNLAHLRNVVARAAHPDDIYGRIDSLNQLLDELLTAMTDEQLGQTARVLFGVADGTRGTKLTVRRDKCVSILGYDPDHFRKRVEPLVLSKVAEELHRDLVRYRSRLRRPVTAYETTRPSPILADEDINAEEALVCRIWQNLYEVRAERIAGLLAEADEDRLLHRDAEERAALRMSGLIEQFARQYAAEYISDGTVDYSIHGLEKLIIWRVASRESR